MRTNEKKTYLLVDNEWPNNDQSLFFFFHPMQGSLLRCKKLQCVRNRNRNINEQEEKRVFIWTVDID